MTESKKIRDPFECKPVALADANASVVVVVLASPTKTRGRKFMGGECYK
jgi:hypothetical protein